MVDLYNNVLLDYRGSNLVELATKAILDSKHFAKEWPFVDAEDQYLRFICRLVPRLCGTEGEMEMVLPVGEIVVVPMHATVGELKQAVENALKDTYSITDEFVLMEIVELEDEELLFVRSGSTLAAVALRTVRLFLHSFRALRLDSMEC